MVVYNFATFTQPVLAMCYFLLCPTLELSGKSTNKKKIYGKKIYGK